MVQSVVTAHTNLVAPIRERIVSMYGGYAALPGYEHKNLPHNYTEHYFDSEITRDTEQFIFKHFVLEFLLNQLNEHNIVVTNWPRLTDVSRNPETEELTYNFILSQPPKLELKEWKHFVFKQPPRKITKTLINRLPHFLKKEWIYFASLIKSLSSQVTGFIFKPSFFTQRHMRSCLTSKLTTTGCTLLMTASVMHCSKALWGNDSGKQSLLLLCPSQV